MMATVADPHGKSGKKPRQELSKKPILILLLAMMAGSALAQEPIGCDKFKWALERERALLAAAAPIAPGGEVAQPLQQAVKLPLSPLAEAKLPMPPSRTPKVADSLAGFVRYAPPPQAATYRVTLSEPAWIDVVQNGQEIKSSAFTGALGCAGIRKSVKFDLSPSPFTIEISGAAAREIAIVVTPD